MNKRNRHLSFIQRPVLSTTVSSSPEFYFDDVGADSLGIKWSPPDSPNGVITDYLITWTDDEDYPLNDTVPATETQYTIEELRGCTNYSVVLQAVNGQGPGDADTKTGVTTTQGNRSN